MNNPSNARRSWIRTRWLLGLAVISIYGLQNQMRAGIAVPVARQGAVVSLGASSDADAFETLLRLDPLSGMIQARADHVRDVNDYECVMVKQELLPSGMSEEQEIAVKYRREPYSVNMEWLRNPGLATRVIYVEGRWTDPTADNPSERELAIAQPGVVARIFVKSVKRPIHGTLARSASRRCLDDFGFERTLDRLIHVCEIARTNGELSLKFRGECQFDGRPVWVVRRVLPYTNEGGRYPDRTAEILIDKEYHIPVAVYCYADAEMRPDMLLAKYEYRSIRMQVGLTEKDFDPVTYGM